MRLHERLGARVATALPHSLRITGTVREWETWTDLALPESGAYVFPHDLAPLSVDRDADIVGAQRMDDPPRARLTAKRSHGDRPQPTSRRTVEAAPGRSPPKATMWKRSLPSAPSAG
jgi:hypothetical protein